MAWSCAAIDHGVTFYEDGKIAPCCLISHTYRKNVSEINNDPFADLKTSTPPTACKVCVDSENNNIPSYRQGFNRQKNDRPGFQFIDIRNTNVCNFKCRTCGPYNSNLWAKELGESIPIRHFSLSNYKQHIVNQNVQRIYYTGGEPLINSEHWELLDDLIVAGISKNITLQYNSNMSVLKFKDKNIFDIWKNFKSVQIVASIDAIGEKFDHIRSGGHWAVTNENIISLRKHNVKLTIGTTVSILNLWFLEELLIFFNDQNILVNLTDLNYPDYLSLSAMPDELKNLALSCVDSIEKIYHDKNKCNYMRSQINDNSNQHLFRDTVMQTLLLDKIRGEKLFDFLPFRDHALKLI
jgi:sulfatase maturation enzyme AslB (radical SAM superfamily)